MSVFAALTLRQRLEPQKIHSRCGQWAASQPWNMYTCTKEKAYQQVHDFILQMDAPLLGLIVPVSKYLRCKQPTWNTNLDHWWFGGSAYLSSRRILDWRMIFNCLRIWMWKSTIGLWVSQCEKTAELSNIWCPLSLRHMRNPKRTSGDTSINNLYHGNVFQNYNTTQGFVALQILHQYKYVMYVYIYIYLCLHAHILH